MKEIIFVTDNEKKFLEVKEFLKTHDINVKQEILKFIEPNDMNQENVVKMKASQAYKIFKKPLIVDDSCIIFDAYNNFPGTFTKLFFKCVGYDGIFNILKNKIRSARFKTDICLIDDNGMHIFSGICKGKIINHKPKNYNNEMPYGEIFIPNNVTETLSKLDNKALRVLSHRYKAILELVKYLKCR